MTEAVEIVINLAEVAGTELCVSVLDGNRVHDAIAAALEGNQQVILDFSRVRRLTTAFLNAAVGQLYNEYDEDQVRNLLLPPQGASQDQLRLLKRVVDNAKAFFSDPERIRSVVRDEVGDD